MAIVAKGQYKTATPAATTDGEYVTLQTDAGGNLKTTGAAAPAAELVLASATGSTGGLGKVSTIAATTGTLLVMCDNTAPSAGQIDWRVKSDKQYSVQFYRSRTIPTATITLADADPVDGTDTFVLNGNTYTYTAGANVLATRVIGLGADNAAAAVNTATMLSDQTYGIIGATAAAAAVSATDVVTITPTTATVLQFAQGLSGAAEVAWADSRIASLTKEPSGLYAAVALNSTTSSGDLFTQWIDGWDYAWAYISNGTGDAQTVTVAATKYA